MEWSLTERQSQIFQLLETAADPVPVSVVAHRLGSSERTIQRDADAMRRTGVPISSTAGRSGGLILDAVSGSGPRPKPRASLGNASPRGTIATFIGRTSESSQLDELVGDAIDGHGRVAMVLGEPGIGKTRTVSELENRLRERGAKTVWGRCRDIEGTPPFWPWAQAVRSLMDDESRRFIDKIPAETTSLIASSIPWLSSLAAESADTEQRTGSSFEVFDAITQLIKTAAEECPLLIVLDDLHWADQASLGLLEFISNEISESQVMLIGTARTVDPVLSGEYKSTLANLASIPNFRRIELDGLSKDQVRQLIESDSSDRAGIEFADEVCATTEGNPFFTLEMSRLYLEDRSRTRDIGSPALALPDAVTGVIERRLSNLSEPCVEILRVGAVLGYRFEYSKLNAIAGSDSVGDPLDLMDDALEARIVVEVTGPGLSYQFSHALTHRYLYDAMPAGRRMRLHARVAKELERSSDESSSTLAGELAFHYAEARDITGVEKAITYSTLAGQLAMAAFAPLEAVTQFQRAISLKGPESNDLETGDLYFSLGTACNEAHLPFEAVDAFTRAMDVFEAGGETVRAIQVASVGIMRGRGDAPAQAAICERGLALVPRDSIEAARILDEYGTAIYANDEPDRALEIFHEAVKIAQREEDPVLEAHILANMALTLIWDRRQAQALPIAERALEIISGLNTPPFLPGLLLLIATVACMEIGDLEEAKRYVTALLDNAVGERSKTVGIEVDFGYASSLALLEGDWAEALRLRRQIVGIHPMVKDVGVAAHIEFMTGDPEAALDDLARLCEIPNEPFYRTLVASNLAMGGLILGDRDAVNKALVAVRDVPNTPQFTPGIDDMVEGVRSAAAIMSGDKAIAKRQYHRLKQFSGMILSFNALIGIDHSLAVLCHGFGDRKSADIHFRDGIELYRKSGIRVWLAWTCHDYVKFQLEDRGRLDQSRAMDTLEEGSAIADELGMSPLRLRFAELREQVQAIRNDVYPDGLTRREVDVLRLVAQGRSNREVAAELFITENTAAKHVANILAKTSSTNRAEAATYAGTHSLLDSPDRNDVPWSFLN